LLGVQCLGVARPVAEEFGRALRAAYEAVGLSQVELARRLQERGWVRVDQSTVSKWVRGVSMPPLEVLPDVDAACGRPRGYVLRLAGYVEDVDPTDVVAAIDADDQLTPEMKQSLKLTYKGLRNLPAEPGPGGARSGSKAGGVPLDRH
jgi:transcriptional regulator with XRE-family HTH domain